ncbi:MAG: alanyl-tRNA editing protein [Chloroflexi bacterium]|nr:alanyl-tRNA editing protein [Chloroflexota bacterium]
MSLATRKLYWADAYRRHFTAQILTFDKGDHTRLVLNRTLFYPTGGGQPHDTGLLGGAQVLDVVAEQGAIVHVLDAPPSSLHEVRGEIDWPRRWDHMQQHSGQHLLSAAFLAELERPTIGFHLSSESLTIDLAGSPPTSAEIRRVLDLTQAIIAEDRPITSRIISSPPADLDLRKMPPVEGAMRIVEIADFDRCACGGTHVHSTAAIGSIIITRLERRGDETRIHFLCGQRAYDDHRRRLAVTQALTAQLTTGLDELPASVATLRHDLKQSQRALRNSQARLLQATATALWAAAPSYSGIKVIRHNVENEDPKALVRLARHLTERGQCLVLLAWPGERPRWIITRSEGVDLDLQQLLPLIRSHENIRGGGSNHTLQGGAVDFSALDHLLDALQTVLIEQLIP